MRVLNRRSGHQKRPSGPAGYLNAALVLSLACFVTCVVAFRTWALATQPRVVLGVPIRAPDAPWEWWAQLIVVAPVVGVLWWLVARIHFQSKKKR